MTDITSASVEMLDVSILPGRRRLTRPAQVAVTLDGVAIMLQDVRILRRADDLSYVEPPCYRHTDGDLVSAMVVPEELEDAIARAVLERAKAIPAPA